MQLADFEYYKETFGGTVFTDEASYSPYAREASLILVRMTNDAIDQKDLESQAYCDAVKSCTCALSEKIKEMEIEDSQGRVASESLGPHSVSYRQEQKKTTAQKEQEYQHVIDLYLFNTGLLYRGINAWREYL